MELASHPVLKLYNGSTDVFRVRGTSALKQVLSVEAGQQPNKWPWRPTIRLLPDKMACGIVVEYNKAPEPLEIGNQIQVDECCILKQVVEPPYDLVMQ